MIIYEPGHICDMTGLLLFLEEPGRYSFGYIDGIPPIFGRFPKFHAMPAAFSLFSPPLISPSIPLPSLGGSLKSMSAGGLQRRVLAAGAVSARPPSVPLCRLSMELATGHRPRLNQPSLWSTEDGGDDAGHTVTAPWLGDGDGDGVGSERGEKSLGLVAM